MAGVPGTFPDELGPQTAALPAELEGYTELTAHFTAAAGRTYTGPDGEDMAVTAYSNNGASADPLFGYAFGVLVNRSTAAALITAVLDAVLEDVTKGLAAAWLGVRASNLYPPDPGVLARPCITWPFSDSRNDDSSLLRLRGSFGSMAIVPVGQVTTVAIGLPEYTG